MIPNRHRADEFQLSVSWMPRVNGVTPETPGFYVRAKFANEGYATGIVKGSWDSGCGRNGSLAPNGFMTALFDLLSDYEMLEKGMGSIGESLDQYGVDARGAALIAKRARLGALRREVAELEAALGA